MARPRKKIDPDQVYKLAAINCSYEEMGAVLKCSPDTLERRFAGVIKEGRANGRMSLKRKQYEVAMTGNVGMLVWLGKNLLGQSDKVETKETQVSSLSKEELISQAKDLINDLEKDKK